MSKDHARTATALLLAVAFTFSCTTASISACPFCTALTPTLTQQREAAEVVALGELLESEQKDASFRLHQILNGEELIDAERPLVLKLDTDAKPGALFILMGNRPAPDKPLEWSGRRVNELSYAYFVKLPPLSVEPAKRLRHFTGLLEHVDPQIAEDAYQEFGHAPYDIVEDVADSFDAARLRDWLVDPAVPDERKGFYGLALGLAPSPKSDPSNEAFLRGLIEDSGDDDFRSGFDGILGGYLVAGGEEALEYLEKLYLANPQARSGHVRHALSALRNFQEFGRNVPQKSLNRAMRRLLARPEFADKAVIELARWKDWQALPQIAALYGREKYEESIIKRAVIGYLLTCPSEAAQNALDKIRQQDPELVTETEQQINTFGGLR